jgi:hypothetical protein
VLEPAALPPDSTSVNSHMSHIQHLDSTLPSMGASAPFNILEFQDVNAGKQPTMEAQDTLIEKETEDLEEQDDEHVDAMGAVSGQTEAKTSAHPSERAYFGPSSTSSFMKGLQCLLERKGHPSLDQRADSNQHSTNRGSGTSENSEVSGFFSTRFRVSRTKRSRTTDFGNFVVPPRKLGDALVASYWTWLHSLYPFLNRSHFNHRYSKIWAAREGGPSSREDDCSDEYDPLFICTLNLVFALGSQFCPLISVAKKSDVGEIFYRRSTRYLDMDSLSRGSVELIQALLLTAQYLQSTERSELYWNVVAIAVRVAQSLGLHVKSQISPDSSKDQLDQETKRRVWGGCLLFDK